MRPSLIRWLARLALGLLTGLTSVVIAACYGAPGAYLRGRVLDARNQQPIPRIRVTCSQDGKTRSFSTTQDGTFILPCERPDDGYLFEDADGPASGGSFKARRLPSVRPVDEILLEHKDP